MKPARNIMKQYQGAVDVCIVGAGAAGSTLAKRLAEAGLSVVVLRLGLGWIRNKTSSMMNSPCWGSLTGTICA